MVCVVVSELNNSDMKDWYLRQTPRDRMIVLIVGMLSIVGLLYAFVWHPVATGLNDNRVLLNTKRDTLQKMEVSAAKLKSLSPVGASNQRETNGKAPYTLIDERIRVAKLGSPDRVEPRGANGARVQFSEVDFDKLVLVLAELELYGLSVDTLNISRSNKNQGMVSARFNMEKN